MFVICDDRCNAAPLLLKNFGVRMCHIFLRFFRPSLGCKQLWESMHKISFVVMHNCSRKKTRKLKIIFVEYLYRRMWRCVLLKFYMFGLFFCFNGVGKYWFAWVRFRFLCVSKSISRHQSRHFSFEKRFLPHGSVLLYGLGQGFLDLGICGGIMTHHQRLMLQKEEEIRNLKETSQLETLCILL